MTTGRGWGHRVGVVVAVAALMIGLGSPASAQDAPDAATPEAAPESSTAWVSISAGFRHTCAIKTSGRLFCWGADDDGQVGDGGDIVSRYYEPEQVVGNTADWASVSAGGVHTCAIKTNGTLFCWGGDPAGQLGDGGANTAQDTPTQVGTNNTWVTVSAGQSGTCARRANGRLFCWGADGDGQLGNGGANTDSGSPGQVSGGATDWRQVSVGDRYACARKSTGRLFCWGDDEDGQLGNGGTSADVNVPTEVSGALTGWASISAGDSTTCARKTGGRLFCWGSDLAGQLGDGIDDGADEQAPEQVSGGFTDWRAASVGTAHTCARRATGQLYCWGADGAGQVGDGVDDSASEPAPVQVGGSTAWTTLDTGGSHACARKNTGRIFCWGQDFYGAIGNGADPGNPDQHSPVEVA